MKHAALTVAIASTLVASGAHIARARTGSVQVPQASSPSEAGTGRAHFVQYGCAQCHAYNGQGGLAGPRLAPDTLPLDAFEQYIRFPSARMPAYAPDQLSSDTVKRMHDYLLSQAAPVPVAEIPLLAERAGALGSGKH